MRRVPCRILADCLIDNRVRRAADGAKWVHEEGTERAHHRRHPPRL